MNQLNILKFCMFMCFMCFISQVFFSQQLIVTLWTYGCFAYTAWCYREVKDRQCRTN